VALHGLQARRDHVYVDPDCKLTDVDPQAWLADAISWIADTPQSRLRELLPWNWKTGRLSRAA
jgi:IS66 C-terminal element